MSVRWPGVRGWVRLGALGAGLGMVAMVPLSLPGDIPPEPALLVAGVAGLAVLAGGWFGTYVPWALTISIVSLGIAAAFDRPDLPSAAVIGLLACAYVLLAELADSCRGSSQVRGAEVRRWLRTVQGLMLFSVAGTVAVVLFVAVVDPTLTPIAGLVVLAPLVLLVVVLLVLRPIRRRNVGDR